MNEYKTKSKIKMQEFIDENINNGFSFDSLEEYLLENEINVNKSTIYRFLNSLVEKQELQKFSKEGSKQSLYIKLNNKECSNHLHMQCTNCGKIFHLDCHIMNELRDHLKVNHHFNIDCKNTIIYGLCSECSKKKD